MTREQPGLERPLSFDLVVGNDAISVAVVRRAVTTAAEVCGDETAQIVGLIFTELVTNAIVHGELRPDDRISVTLQIGPQGIRGSVRDPGIGFEISDPPEPRADGGFGLFIVQRIARRWGVERADGATEVWFEL
jgi:two-component sensor histidine kinase